MKNEIFGRSFLILCLINMSSIFSGSFILGQTPKNLNENVNYSKSFTYKDVVYACDKCNNDQLGEEAVIRTISDITKLFNFSRRDEERQLNLTPLSLGTLEIPANFSSYSPAGKVFYLLNEERKCRNLQPFQSIEEGLSIFATKHAEYCDQNNYVGHNGPNGESFESRTANIYKAWKPTNEPCYSGFSENCATVQSKNIEWGARSLLTWIYIDGNSRWIHREICFQNCNSCNFGYGEKRWVSVMETANPKQGGNCNSQLKLLSLTENVTMPSPITVGGSPASSGGATGGGSSQPRSELSQDQSLNLGEAITSPNLQYKLSLDNDGNLVLYQNGQGLWYANSANQSVSKCSFQNDGNLVLYTANNQAKWAVDANGRGGNTLKIQNDGNLVIYRQDNSIVWTLKMNNGQYDQNGGKGLLK
ncbi:MAG: hypothetical protein WBP08_17610 [Saprospiraceae bacterium]